MNVGTLKERLADVPDDAEVYFHNLDGCGNSLHFSQVFSADTLTDEPPHDSFDVVGNEIPAGSLLLFPA